MANIIDKSIESINEGISKYINECTTKKYKKRGHRQGGALAFGVEGNERLEEEEKERKKTK